MLSSAERDLLALVDEDGSAYRQLVHAGVRAEAD
jgi:hypothetical protein